MAKWKWIAATAVATSLLAAPAAMGTESSNPASTKENLTQLSLKADGAVIEYGGQEHRFDLDGNMALEKVNELPDSLQFDVESFRMAGQDEKLGQITVQLDEQGPEPTSVYKPSLTGGEHSITLPLRITFTPPATSGDKKTRQSDPVVLITKTPPTLVTKTMSFPPNGDLYRLEEPTQLYYGFSREKSSIMALRNLPVIGTL